MTIYAITTKDNPFNPFDDFSQWFAYDESKGYHSSERLARIAKVSNGELSLEDDEQEVSEAIDDIILNDPFDIYIKVKKEV